MRQKKLIPLFCNLFEIQSFMIRSGALWNRPLVDLIGYILFKEIKIEKILLNSDREVARKCKTCHYKFFSDIKISYNAKTSFTPVA